MPESQEPKSRPPMGVAGNAPPAQQEQVQQQSAQELDPAVLDAYFDTDEDGNGDGDAGTSMNPIGAISLLARQFSFVLIPFLFAIVTLLLAFLFLSVHSAGQHGLAVSELWAIGLIALAMAVLQGMMLYYSGSNAELWFLSLLVGFVLFPPVLFFALDGATASLITLGIMIVVCLVIAWICKEFVQEGHVGLVYSFGKYLRTLPPGLHFLPPWERVTFTLDTRESQWTCPQQIVRMSPNEDLSLAGTIAYEIIPEDAHLTVQYVNEWEQQLKDRFRATLQNIAREFKPEDFYPWQSGAGNRPDPNAVSDTHAGPPEEKTPGWGRMNARLLQLMQEQAAPWGVQINWATIHDVVPLPHFDHVETVRAGTGAARGAGIVGAASTANSVSSSRPGTTRVAPTPPQRQNGAPAASASVPQPPPAAPTAATQVAQTQVDTDPNKKLYDAVRSGGIKDPETIRRIARNFEDIAQDPVKSQNFPFDAARAASNLYARAKYYEDLISASAEFSYNDEYDEDGGDDGDGEDGDISENLSGPTQVDWLRQPPPDDDLTARGG